MAIDGWTRETGESVRQRLDETRTEAMREHICIPRGVAEGLTLGGKFNLWIDNLYGGVQRISS